MCAEFWLWIDRSERYDGPMQTLTYAMYVLGGLLFLGSVVAQLCVRVWLRPRDPDLDEIYHEFEDEHPEYARYCRWLKLTTASATLGLLMTFAAVAL